MKVSFNPAVGGRAMLTVTTWGPRDTRFPNLIRQIREAAVAGALPGHTEQEEAAPQGPTLLQR